MESKGKNWEKGKCRRDSKGRERVEGEGEKRGYLGE